jgi:NhaP-type Na+/H+ or K+/H+ antiporter
MQFELWAVVIGSLLITMAMLATSLRPLPLSTAMLYLAVGFALGPAGLDVLSPDPLMHAEVIERVAELAVLLSLFSVGLKLGKPQSHRRWQLPLRLVLVSMTVTVALIALIGMIVLDLSAGAAILLGAILAPTDPVLASDVQVQAFGDNDRLRFSLTGEGGLNDGAAFPFVMLGLGLLGLHDLGSWGWRWFTIDVLWATGGGLLIGGALGVLVGRVVVALRRNQVATSGLDEFLALGLIALAYGLAVLCHTYGFLAVFAAGLALQRVREAPVPNAVASADVAGDGDTTPSDRTGSAMTEAVQSFNEQLERIAEVAIVTVLGALLSTVDLHFGAAAFGLFLLLFVRPLSVWLGLIRARVSGDQRVLIAWFGIRGIGSIYYLMYAINHGLPAPLALEICTLTLTAVALSIVLHGVSVTPLMRRYMRRKSRLSSPPVAQ